MPIRTKGKDWTGACPVCGEGLNELNAMLDRYNPRPQKKEVECSYCENQFELNWWHNYLWVIFHDDSDGIDNVKIKMDDWDKKCPKCKGSDRKYCETEYSPIDGGYYSDISRCVDCGCYIHLVYTSGLLDISLLGSQSISGKMVSIRKILGGDKADSDQEHPSK